MTGAAGPNLILYTELAGDVVSTLEAVMTLIEDGDEVAVMNVGRSELPGITAGLLTFMHMHEPDENGHCRTCSRRWRPQHVPCRALLKVTKAVHENTVITCPAT